MKTAIIHARLITSDFDEGYGPGRLFDRDVRVGTVRAYRQALRHINSLARANKGPKQKDVQSIIRPDIVRISRDYWCNFDIDDRKTSAKLKPEAAKLLHPLKSAIAALKEAPPYVRLALNTEVTRSVAQLSSEYESVYENALAANQALAHACEIFVKRGHQKKGSAIRFQNACRELFSLWERIFRRKFPRNIKTAPATDREISQGLKRVFISPGALFVYMILREIGNRWVTVAQVEEALGKLAREGK